MTGEVTNQRKSPAIRREPGGATHSQKGSQMTSQTATTEGRHRDDSPQAQERCERRESSPLMIRLNDAIHDPRHSAEYVREAAA